MKLRKGDTVKVLSGKDKGKTGEILEVIKKTKKTKNRKQKNCGEKKNFSFRFIIFIFITPNKKTPK